MVKDSLPGIRQTESINTVNEAVTQSSVNDSKIFKKLKIFFYKMQIFPACLISAECIKFINMRALTNKTYKLYLKDILTLLNGIEKC